MLSTTDVMRMKRDSESVDDFEHLGHDSSPLKESTTDDLLAGFKTEISDTARDIHNKIDKRVENVARNVIDTFDPLADVPVKMDPMGDHFQDTGDKLDKFLDDFNPTVSKVGVDKNSIQNFMDREREVLHDLSKQAKESILLDRYSDSEPEHDDFKPSMDDNFPKKDLREDSGKAKTDSFKDLDDFLQKSSKKVEEPQKSKTPELVIPPEPVKTQESVILPEKISRPVIAEEPVKPILPEPIDKPSIIVQEPIKRQPEFVKPEAVKKEPVKIVEKQKIAPADAGAIFRKIGIGKSPFAIL